MTMTVHFKAPADLVDPATGTRAWLFDASATVVTQTSGDMTLAAARFMSTQVEDEVARRWVQAGRKVHYVHDWSSCANYDVEGRQVLIDWARHTRPHSLKSTIHIHLRRMGPRAGRRHEAQHVGPHREGCQRRRRLGEEALRHARRPRRRPRAREA